MTTLSTNFAGVPARSRAERLSDSVVAGYIRDLAAPTRRADPKAVSSSSTVGSLNLAMAHGDDAKSEIIVSRASDDAGVIKRNPCWSRGGRMARSSRLQHLLETR